MKEDNFTTALDNYKPASMSEGYSMRRVRITEEELKNRLDHFGSKVEGFEVTDEHLDVLKFVFTEHNNVFITGGAGTGKTTFVRSVLIPELDYRNLNWAVTATTGIAGSHLDGKTMHSFFGIGRGPEWPEDTEFPNPQEICASDLEAWYEKFYTEWCEDTSIRPKVRQGIINRLRAIEVVIIDEISMCHGDGMLGYICYMLQKVRDDPRPFGGVQMIMIGDFAQIPPVETRSDIPRPDWAFMSRVWANSNVKSIELTKIFRQGDAKFINFLNAIRVGRPYDRDYVDQFVVPHMTDDETSNYTFLMPTNDQARDKNVGALERFEAPTTPLPAKFNITESLLPEWEKRNQRKVRMDLVKAMRLVDETIFIRVGYPVMFAVNDPEGRFCNGTRGFVRSIHVAPNQGQAAYLEIGVQGKDGEEQIIKVQRWRYSRNRKQSVMESIDVEDEETGEAKSTFRWPVVEQFPIIPAVAITIHKSQGMSMDYAILSLTRSFAPGQVYVALSRLTSPDGLVLLDADFQVRTDPYVTAFYQSLTKKPNLIP